MSTITSAQDGDWNTAATWVGGTVPTSADTVVIEHAVTIKSNATADIIKIQAGSLTAADDWDMSSAVTLTCTKMEMARLLNDTRRVRLDGITLIIGAPSITASGTLAGDGWPTNLGLFNAEGEVLIDDPGILAYSAQMQDIKPEGIAHAYARKTGNAVRYMTLVVQIRANKGQLIGRLYRMAEGPFQVLAVSYSSVIKGYIEAITPVDSVGKEYRAFRVSIAEGQAQ